jgi:hypothetical protein
VEPHEVVKAYNADKHPDVISGKKTKDQVLREFLDTFDVGGVKDGMVTKKEFENYYTNIGANIPDDDYFELMIRNAWHIAGGKGWCESSANKYVRRRSPLSVYSSAKKERAQRKGERKESALCSARCGGAPGVVPSPPLHPLTLLLSCPRLARALRRVLVTHSDGSQSVVEMQNDLGMPQPGTKEEAAEIVLRLKKQGVDVMGIDTTGSTEEKPPPATTSKDAPSAEFAGGGKKGLGVENPTFTSSIMLGGVGTAPGKERVGKVGVTRPVKGRVAADHVDIHQSELKNSLG